MTYRPKSQGCSSLRGASTVAALALIALPMLLTSIRAAGQTALNPAADEITFTNGDKLTGKVIKESGGVVIFQSDMAGGRNPVSALEPNQGAPQFEEVCSHPERSEAQSGANLRHRYRSAP